MDRRAWWAIVHRVTKSRTRLSHFTLTFTLKDRSYLICAFNLCLTNADVMAGTLAATLEHENEGWTVAWQSDKLDS